MQDTIALNRAIAMQSAADQQATTMLAGSLVRLSELRNVFSSCIALIDFAEAQSRQISKERQTADLSEPFLSAVGVFDVWRGIAAREAAIVVYHFGHALGAVRANMQLIPALGTPEALRCIRRAKKHFDKSFPRNKQIRDAVCHVAENSLTLSKVKLHAHGGVLVWGRLDGHTFTITKDRSHYVMKVDEQSLSDLIEIGQTVYEALPSWRDALPDLRRRSDRESRDSM